MHCLTRRALGCLEEMQMRSVVPGGWPLLRETRRHHFTDRLPQAARAAYDKNSSNVGADAVVLGAASDDDGHITVNVFPGTTSAPARIAGSGSCAASTEAFPLDADVEEILVELLTGPWA